MKATLIAATAALCLAAAPVSAEPDRLARARAAVDRQDYAAALADYALLVDARSEDVDLLIEAARVHGWADRNAEAAQLYRRAIALAPARRDALLSSLAWQTLWSGDAAAARPLFQELAARPGGERAEMLDGLGQTLQALGDATGAAAALQDAHGLAPANRRLHRRMATALLWSGQEAAAVAELQALHRLEPDDRDVAWSLANALNFSGRSLAALRTFALQSAATGGERLDVARAWWWAGFPERALPLLGDAQGTDARWLRDWRVLRETRPFGRLGIDHAQDRDALKARAVVAAAGWHPAPGATVEFRGRHLSLDEPAGVAGGNEFQATLGWRLGEPASRWGLWWPTIGLRTVRYPGWSSWLPQFRLRGLPDDGWRVDAEVVREPIETPRAVAERVTVDVVSAGVERRLGPTWLVGGSAALLRFDDGTRRVRLGARTEHVLSAKARLVASIETMAFERTSGGATDRGYWNPRRYAEAKASLAWTQEWRPFDVQARIGLGRSSETDDAGRSTSGRPDQWTLALGWDLSPSLRLELSAGGSGAGGGLAGGGAGYWRRYANLGMQAWW